MKKKTIKKICIIMYGIFFLVIAVFVCFGKRTVFSEKERRNTLKLSNYEYENIYKINPGSFFEKVFIDTIPYRDKVVDLYISLKKYKGINDEITIINVENKTAFNNDFSGAINKDSVDLIATVSEIDYSELELNDYEVVNVINGINKVVVVGKGKNVRGLNLFNGFSNDVALNIAHNVNLFTDILKKNNINVNIYYIIIPLPCAFYLPEELKKLWINQFDLIENVYSKILNSTCVNIYDTLFKHKEEDIYLRTDSHWSQRGAYYAGKEFANIAKVPYADINNDYVKKEIKDYCSSFYRYTEDKRFIDCHETFYYYKPKIKYNTTQIYYEENEVTKDKKLIIEKDTDFFKDTFSISKDYAYWIFMGGDNKTTVVNIDCNKTNRKLLLIKDSFGNCFAPNLFYSFDELHIIDFRYFKNNLINYIKENEITDILLLSQINMANAESKKYTAMLTY